MCIWSCCPEVPIPQDNQIFLLTLCISHVPVQIWVQNRMFWLKIPLRHFVLVNIVLLINISQSCNGQVFHRPESPGKATWENLTIKVVGQCEVSKSFSTQQKIVKVLSDSHKNTIRKQRACFTVPPQPSSLHQYVPPVPTTILSRRPSPVLPSSYNPPNYLITLYWLALTPLWA